MKNGLRALYSLSLCGKDQIINMRNEDSHSEVFIKANNFWLQSLGSQDPQRLSHPP